MFCEKCGKNNPVGATACSRCGWILTTLAPTGSPARHGDAPRAEAVGSTYIGVAEPGSGNQVPPSFLPRRGDASSGAAPSPVAVGAHQAPVIRKADSVASTFIGVGTTKTPYLPSSTDRETCRAALTSLIRKYGSTLCDNPTDVESSLLREFQRDIALIMAAQREGVPTRLLAAASAGDVSASAEEAVQHLVTSCQLSEEDARYAVDSWALALGLAGR